MIGFNAVVERKTKLMKEQGKKCFELKQIHDFQIQTKNSKTI